ncbi:beta-galactoside alpha-2,6-sialyltransferase 1-like isoform X2 [Brienomyrus brachyistius]|uniref:beta-galactoside alpha-2,6-sialyltransferase 1-like isoform X2 n=1 Tax=Brienomyrus brachyistius TaxID=42636 RepID=UPI0020B4080C|nr:beta-galactoside alpha-2,6-sialyltransferase 1-like isoform X2 [Brienomyrus brachyistius]
MKPSLWLHSPHWGFNFTIVTCLLMMVYFMLPKSFLPVWLDPAATVTAKTLVWKVQKKHWPVWDENATEIGVEMRRAIQMFWKINKFVVPPNITHRNVTVTQSDIMQELRTRVPLRTIEPGDGPFSRNEWQEYLPRRSLEQSLGPLKTCAVVMSSGSIVNSALGAEIDKHDAVLRFNAAPTQNYSADVGIRTSMRLVNSQVLTSNHNGFLTNPLYSTGVLIMWDPSPYSKDLYAWYKNPDFNFFRTYLQYRKLHPEQLFYILSPSFQWNLWDIIQENSPVPIQPHPPSSGMLGIVVMMNLCEQISVYEFLPSRRRTSLCHYFENIHNKQCTMGHYHPITFEKNLIKRLNHGTDYDIYSSGKVTLRGFSQLNSSPGILPIRQFCLLWAVMILLILK